MTGVFYSMLFGMFVGALFGVGFAMLRTRSRNKCGMTEKGKKKSRSAVKKENKQKTLDFIATKKKVKNDDIQNLLGVSDATATRYLDELEKAGKIKQVGKTSDAYYIKK